MKSSINDDVCPICGYIMDVRCIGNRNSPFVDGITYNAICFVCYSIPKIWVFENNEWRGPYLNGEYLRNPEELIEEGITEDKKHAKKSYQCIKKKIGKSKN